MAKEIGQNRENRVFSRVFGDKTWLKRENMAKETTIK
jgi:hypothetical protein